MGNIKSPFGAADVSEMTATGAQAVTVSNSGLTVVDGTTVIATGNRTLNLTLDGELETGAEMLVTHKSTATETLTYGTGITAPVITGVAGKSFTQGFVFDGTGFVPMGASVQID